MAPGNENRDPNDDFPQPTGKDHDPISQADAWAEKQNPVREEALPARNLRQTG